MLTTSENNSGAHSSDVTGGYLKGIARNILLALSSDLERCNISSCSNSNLNTSFSLPTPPTQTTGQTEGAVMIVF